MIFHSLKQSIILIKDVYENIIPRYDRPFYHNNETLEICYHVDIDLRPLLCVFKLYITEPMAISVCRLVFARIISLMEAINGS